MTTPLTRPACWSASIERRRRLGTSYAYCSGHLKLRPQRDLQDADAADLMQEVLFGGRAVGAPTRSGRGTFRAGSIPSRETRFYFLESRRQHARGTGGNAHQRLEEYQAKSEVDDWDREYERKAFAWAARPCPPRVPANTWQASG